MEETKATEPKTTKQKWSLKKKIVVIAGSIVAVLIALLTLVNVATSEPLKISDELISYIQSSKSTEAYDLMSSAAQNATSSSDFKAAVEQIGPILTGEPEVQSKEITADTDSDPTSTIVYKIAGNDGLTYLFTVNLVQNDGEWKILNFESEEQ